MPQRFAVTTLLASRIRIVLATLSCLLLVVTGFAQQPTSTVRTKAQIARLPLAFEPNQGQAEPQVKFLSRGPGYLLLLTKDEAVLALGGSKAGKYDVVRLQLTGAKRNVQTAGLDALEGKTNYFLGNDPKQWRTNIPNYSKVRYTQVYPGIDLMYYGKQNSLEHDFVVAPNADPGKIALKVKGAKQLRVDEKGNLLLTTANGQIQLDRPFIFQTDKSGKRIEVAGGYALNGNRVSFHVGTYDKSRELVIDPVLNYATYFGGDSTTTVKAITLGPAGNSYITGSTQSSAGTLAGTVCASCGAPDRDGTTKMDVFVAKLNSSGTAYTFVTIVGGAGDEHGNAIAVDGSSNVFVVGQTSSGTFPTTAGAYRTVVGNVTPDGFAFELSSTGATLMYSTYLNGGAVATDGADDARGVALNAAGEMVIVGTTASTTFFPGAHLFGTDLTENGGTSDAFLMRLNPGGAGAADLNYGTYWGGSSEDVGNALVLQTGNRAVIVGHTQSADYPTGGSAPDSSLGGTQDGFVAAISTGAAFISTITCIDTTADRTVEIVTSSAHGLSVGDNFHILNVTNAGGITFANVNKTVSAVQSSTVLRYGGENNCNNADGVQGGVTGGVSRVVGRRNTSTYAGGNLVDSLNAVAMDGTGAIYAVGTTTSTAASSGIPSQSSLGSGGLNGNGAGSETDAWVLKLAANLQSFTFSGLLGGAGNDSGTGIVVNPTCTSGCEAYVVGTTASTGKFNSNSLQSALSGTTDGFIVRVNSAGGAILYSTYFGGTGDDSIAGVAASYAGTAGATDAVTIAANTSTTIGAASSFGTGATVTSSAAQGTPGAGATGSVVVAKLAANNASSPTLVVSATKSIDPIGQSTAQTSSVVYTWTVTNQSGSNGATGVTLDVPTPQSGGNDLLTISTTNQPSLCTTKVGTSTQPGGMTCVFGIVASNNGAASVQVTASPTATAHCDNAACPVPTITLTGRANGAEPGAAVSNTVVSNVVPVTNLDITGTAVSTPGGNAVYRLGIDTAMKYTITVTNNSGATIAANDAGLDVLIESVYSTDPLFVVSSVKLNTVVQVLGPLVQGVAGCFDNTANNKVQCNVLSIPAGGNAVVEINGSFNTGTINPAVALLNTTSKFGAAVNTEIFTATGNNTNKAVNVDYQGPIADLQITSFTDAPDPVRTTQDLTYTVVYDNVGPTDATNVKITLTPAAPSPANTGKFTFALNTNGTGSVPVVCAQAGGAGTAIDCTIADADVATAAAAFTFDVVGTLTLDANVPTTTQAMTAVISTTGATSEPVGGTANNTANASTVVRREAALSVTNFSASSTVANGQTFTYGFDVANGGLDNATNSVVTMSLPQNTNPVTFTGNTFTNQACSGTTTVTCDVGTLNAGVSGVGITVTVTPPTLGAGVASAAFNGSITGFASANVVSTGGTKTAGNILTTVQRQTTISVANLANTGSSIASTATAGYTVDVFNTGANPGTNVKIDFTVPSGTTTPTAGCAVQAPTVIRCNVANVPTGGIGNKVTLAVSFTPPAALLPSNQSSAAFTTTATFNAVASTEIVDSGAGTATDPAVGTIDVSVERRADVQMFNLTATPTVSSAGNITVQAQVQNLSGVTATNVQVVFTFDHNYLFQSANVVNANGIPNSPVFSCAVSTATTRTCTLPNLPISTLYTFNVIVRPEAGIVATNNPGGNSTTVNVSATISASVIQSPNTGNDSSGPLATEVQRQANLRASGGGTAFSGPVGAINSSATATYSLTVRNDGPDTTDGSVVVFSFTNNVVLSLDTSPAAQAAWGGLGTCVRNNASTVTCTMAPGFATGARSGAITISPDAATLLAATNSAPYDVTAFISSVNAYDNGASGAAGSDNTTSIVTTTVQRQADLRLVSKTAPPAVADGGNISYTIVVQNFGPDSAGSVRLIDPLPSVANGTVTAGATGGFTLNAAGATFVSPTIPAGVCTPNSGSPTAPPVTVVCMLGPLNSGQSATITISGKANIDAGVSSASFNNVATVDAAQNVGDPVGGGTQTAFETNGGNNSNSVVSTTVSRSADLYMVDPVLSTPVLTGGVVDPLGPGTPYVVGTHQAIKYDISVGNNAASSTDVGTASVQTTLPSTLTFDAAASPGCSAVGQIVTCPVPGALVKGGPTTTVSFVATPGATLPISGSNVALTITPSVSASGNTDPNGSDNVVNNTTTVNRVSDLGIVQTQPLLPISVTVPNGSTATFNYTWTVTNNGPSNATSVSVTNALPADLTFVSGSWPAVTGTSAGTCSAAGQNVTCNVSTINNGAAVTITVTVRPNLNVALANKSVGNQPSVTGLVQDNVNANNNSFTSVELRGVTDLQVTITPVQNPVPTPVGKVLTGDNQTWAVSVKNNGPYPAGGVITLTDTIGGTGVTTISVLPAAGGTFGCVGNTCTVSGIPPSPAPGSTQTVNVITTTPASAVTGQTTLLSNSAVVTQYSNGTTVASDVTDPTPANNSATANITGQAAADLSVSQTAPSTLQVPIFHNGVKYSVTVSNAAGRSDATNVVLTNSIAINPSNSVPTVANGTVTAGTGSCAAATGLGTATITIACTFPTIPSGTSATVNLVLQPTLDSGVGNGLTNTPTVTRAEVDPVSGNNAAPPLGIRVSTTGFGQQTFSPTNPNNGQPITSAVITGFINVPGATTMTVTPSATPPNPNFVMPLKYQFGDSATTTIGNFYTISNTAQFNGPIQVCFATTEAFFQPSKVRVFLISGSPADDRTISANYDQVVNGTTPERQVCGSVPNTGLASGGTTFVVMEPINTAPPLGGAVVTVSGGGGKGTAGTSIVLDGSTVLDPDAFKCMKNGVDSLCTEQNTLIFRWVGNFLDIQTIDPVTGLKLIVKNCQTATFTDGLPCNQAATSIPLGSSTITLTVFDDFYVLNPPPQSRTFNVGSTGSSGGSTAQTVSQGQTGTFTFSYTYGANTTFTFTGTPALSANLITCSAQPLTYTGLVGGTQTSTVTVLCSTSAPVFAMNHPVTNPADGGSDGTMLAGIVGITGLPLVGMVLMPGRSRRGRRVRMLAALGLIALMMVFQAACGGGSTGGGFGGAPKQVSAGTAKGNYSIAVTATPAPTAGNPAATLTLTVQ